MPNRINLPTSEQLGFATIQITATDNNGRTSSGTGFFFRFFFGDEDKLISTVVTNRHVIKGGVTGVLSFHVCDQQGCLKPMHQYRLNIIEGFESHWLPHPDPSIDLAIMISTGDIIQKMRDENSPPFCVYFDQSMIPTNEELGALVAIEEIIMVGYPIGLWDSMHNLPLFRRGITATHPAIPFNGKPEFLVDAACFPGSSGSPVILYNPGSYTDRMDQIVMKPRMKLLGILYAGPQMTLEGEIKIVPIPVAQLAIAQSRIPINVGFVLKSSLLLDFEPLVKARLKK